MHDINVTVFTPNFVKVIQELQTELHLFQLSDGTKASNVKGELIYYASFSIFGTVKKKAFSELKRHKIFSI